MLLLPEALSLAQELLAQELLAQELLVQVPTSPAALVT